MTDMTEFGPFHPEYNETDSNDLRRLLREMQGVVDEHMKRLNKPVSLMTPEEIRDFCDRVAQYVAFVPHDSDLIETGTEIAFSGLGGFFVVDSDGEITAAQNMDPGDAIAGIVSHCVVTVVPSARAMMESSEDEVSTADYSMSAALLLDGGLFRAELQPDGTHDISADLGSYQALVPLIYDMEPRALAA